MKTFTAPRLVSRRITIGVRQGADIITCVQCGARVMRLGQI